MSEYLKPLPTLNKDNRPFWEGCKQGKLRMQCCGACGHVELFLDPDAARASRD